MSGEEKIQANQSVHQDDVKKEMKEVDYDFLEQQYEFEDVAETADEITVEASVIIDESVNIIADIKDVSEERQ